MPKLRTFTGLEFGAKGRGFTPAAASIANPGALAPEAKASEPKGLARLAVVGGGVETPPFQHQSGSMSLFNQAEVSASLLSVACRGGALSANRRSETAATNDIPRTTRFAKSHRI